MPNTIAIIPARGGSKGIPRKNVRVIQGKPLIAWNIEAVRRSKLIDEVYVSTDDEEIALLSQKYGAKIIHRPTELAGDEATSESALIHALEELSTKGISPKLLVFMQCTSPLTSTNDVDTAIQQLIGQNADSCLTVTDFHYFVWKSEKDGTANGINHDKSFRPRRQDREPQFVENGAVYVMKASGFLKSKHRFFGKTVMSIMPQERSMEIDEPIDFKIAESLLRQQVVKNQEFLKNGETPKAILFDFDGVFTNNKVYVDETGRESVQCDRSDGWGLSQLKKREIKIAVLSTEENPVVSARCQKLGLECRQGLGEKKFEALINWCMENDVKPEETIFVGNDVNDIECLQHAGCGIAPADAHPEALKAADHILSCSGGYGAVREICDIVSNTNI